MSRLARRGLAPPWLAIACAAGGVLLSLAASAAITIPEGKGVVTFRDARGHANRELTVHTYRPARCDARCPLQFVLHGVSRNADGYRDYWVEAAERHGFVVVSPLFTREAWGGAAAYNRGGVDATDERSRWAFAAIEHLFDEIADGRKDYRLFGHSAGAQFVHRFLYFVPNNRASVAVAANAGWYTIPEWRNGKVAFPWPHSLAQARAGEKEARRALGQRLVVMLGDADTDPTAQDLDRTPGSLAQGANRLERGRHFHRVSSALARDIGVDFRWDLVIVPGVAHSGRLMSAAAAEHLYGAVK